LIVGAAGMLVSVWRQRLPSVPAAE
jgi:hypothetical protein